MKGKIWASLSYAKNWLTTGAFVQTNRKVESEICKHIPKDENTVVVEYGMGYGNISRQILKQLPSTGRLYAFEVNKAFCDEVQKTIKDDRLVIINDSAENLKLHVEGKVDVVISSLPLSLFSEEKRYRIMLNANDFLTDRGYLSQVLLTSLHRKVFLNAFGNCLLVKLMSFPIYYVYHSQKRSAE